ncbi:MAG TPA: PKD domain-containing protein, partial [Solirubrobacter sp.]
DADGQYDDGGGYIATPTYGPGTHTVSVRVTDGEGGTAVASRTIVVGSRPPAASFTSSVAEPSREEPVTFTSTSTDPDGGPIASTAWDLDDDGAFDDATGPVTTTSFATAGTRRVGVKVRDDGGDNGIRYATVTVGTGVFVPAPTPSPEPTATPLPNPGPAATPAPQGDKTAPKVTASVKTATRKSGVSVKVGCSEACKVTVVLTVDKATAKRLKVAATLGRATGKAGTITVKLSAKAKAALKRQRSVKATLTITAVDAAGNRTVTTKTLTIRR